jgi:methyl-accepting chemotaxis protein
MLNYLWNINTRAKLMVLFSSIIMGAGVAAFMLIRMAASGDKLLESERLYGDIQNGLIAASLVRASGQQPTKDLTSFLPQASERLLELSSDLSSDDKANTHSYQSIHNQLLAFSTSLEGGASVALSEQRMTQFRDEREQLNSALGEWHSQNDKQSISSNLMHLLALLLMCFLLPVVTLSIIASGVVYRLKEARRRAVLLSDGHLNRYPKEEGHDDSSEVLRQFTIMSVNIEGSIRGVSGVANSVTKHASNISENGQTLSSIITAQGQSINSTMSLMQRMDEDVKLNSTSAEEVEALASEAVREATHGGKVIQQSIDAMASISKSSNEISNTIEVIDEIAFQTNLLALNAAVEAARSGEHGRGFAVVAAEVRNLAQRSAEAAKEISLLIEASKKQVSQGEELAKASSETLSDIISSVEKVGENISIVGDASRKQSTDITTTVNTMSSVVERMDENLALITQTTSASDLLLTDVGKLRKTISFFKISGDISHDNSESGSVAEEALSPSEVRRTDAEWDAHENASSPLRAAG